MSMWGKGPTSGGRRARYSVVTSTTAGTGTTGEATMPKYVYRFRDGGMDQKDLRGGKGANRAGRRRLGLPVPPGFTITAEACRAYMRDGHVPPELRVEVTLAVRQMEDALGRGLGDFHEPLLVSVRSGAKFSMPGMIDRKSVV